MFTLTVEDRAVQAALTRLTLRATNLQPILQSLGEDLMERSKKRFASSTAPDGTRWAANARSTIEAFIKAKGGFGKKGLNKKGQGLAMSKKPLIGDSGSLRQQFHVKASPASLIVANSMRYAAIQQFGGRKAVYRQLWGYLPARPFLPVQADGSLYPAEQSLILAVLQSFLERA
jgi:phage virion morphogenesis protein